MGARGWGKALLLTLAVSVVGTDLAIVASRHRDRPPTAAATIERRGPIVDVAPTEPSTTTIPPTTTTSAAPTTTVVPPVTAAPTTTTTVRMDTRDAMTASTERDGAWTLGPYNGTGVWLDVYD